MKIVTVVSNESHPGFFLLKLSCALNDLELVVLVSSEKNFTSRRLKDQVLKDYLWGKDNDEIILFTDGYDAIFMSGEEEILRKYYQFEKDLVFSTETNCWPDSKLAAKYPVINSSYRYLNSGGFIGKVGVIKELLDDYSFKSDEFENSNQYLWAHRYLKYPDIIGLDASCDLFCTFSPEIGGEHLPKGSENNPRAIYNYYMFKQRWFLNNFAIENNRIFSKNTNTWPVQAHFNGDAKHLMDKNIMEMVLGKIPSAAKIQTY